MAGGDKWVYIFPKGISPKVNVKAQLEFELAYLKAIIKHFSHYTTCTLPHRRMRKKKRERERERVNL